MANIRKCMMCGKKYEWCINCGDRHPEETWRYLYHDENCMKISNIWYAYRGKEISKEEAKKQMDKYQDNINDILKNDSIPAMEIRDIYGVKEEKVDVEEVPVVEETVEPVKEEIVDKKDEKVSFDNKGNKNKK